jgi:hypothetical protein
MKRTLIIILILIFGLGLSFRIFCGIFVIQPIGAIPDGTTIIYWRNGLDIPFISSADGMLVKSGAGVSLMGRGLMLGKMAEPIKEREIIRIGYIESLYLLSTEGKKYEN